jgi:hypothetical protein
VNNPSEKKTYWQCIAAAGAAAFGTFIGGASMAYSLTNNTNLFLNLTMMISLSAATAGIVVAGGGSALPAFSATTSVAVIVGAACLYKGEMFLNQQKKCTLAPGICAVVLGATAVQAGLAYTAASVVIYAAPVTSLLGGGGNHRFGLCTTICALAASNAFYIGALARVNSHSILSIIGAAIGGASGAAAGAYICGASFFVTAAAVAGVISGFLFMDCLCNR